MTVHFCLRLICSHYDYGLNCKYIFEGYGRSEIHINKEDVIQYNEAPLTLFHLYQWAFSEGNISTKLGILRNIISLQNTNNFSENFHDNLTKVVFSNYQIYLKENITKYIEIKGKAIELISNLNEKLVENFYSMKKGINTSIIAVFSYLFSVVLLRTISAKRDVLKLFDMEIFFITLIFSIAACTYIIFLKLDFSRHKKLIVDRLNNIKLQFSGILSEQEREDTFSKSLLVDLDKEFIEATLQIKIYIFILIFLNVIIFALATFNLVSP